MNRIRISSVIGTILLIALVVFCINKAGDLNKDIESYTEVWETGQSVTGTVTLNSFFIAWNNAQLDFTYNNQSYSAINSLKEKYYKELDIHEGVGSAEIHFDPQNPQCAVVEKSIDTLKSLRGICIFGAWFGGIISALALLGFILVIIGRIRGK